MRLSSPLLDTIRTHLGFAAFLSLFVNLLTLSSPIYMLQVFDRVLVSGNRYTLLMLTLITVFLVATYAVLDMLRSRILLRAGLLLEQDLGPRALERTLQFQQGRPPGTAELLRDVSTLRNYLSGSHLTALFDAPWAPVFTLIIFLLSPMLGLVSVVGMLLILGLAFADERLTFERFSRANQQMARAGQFTDNAVRNAEIISALGMKPAMVHLWRGLSRRAAGALKGAADRSAYLLASTKAARTLLQVAMLGTGAYLIVTDANASPGIMIAGTIIVARAVAPVEAVVAGWRGFIEARGAFARLDKLFEQAAAQAASAVELPKIRGGVQFEGVHFGFGPNQMVIGNLTLKLESGQALGVVGPSGAGKSTLARLALGLARPQQGRVLIDGYDVQSYDPVQFGRQIGYVPQDAELFEGTIGENICRMQDPAEHSAEVVRVAELCGVDAIVARLPDGYSSRLSAGGANLSGGERQLVALARALFGRPALLVLDEPDANLDQQGEARLVEILGRIRAQGEATILLVSHNPGLVDRMDRLLRLKPGGGHDLLARSAPPAVPLRAGPAGS